MSKSHEQRLITKKHIEMLNYSVKRKMMQLLEYQIIIKSQSDEVIHLEFLHQQSK